MAACMKRSVSRSSRFWCLGSGFSGRRPRRMISGSSCCSMVLVQPSAPSITTVESSSSSSRRWQSSRSVSAARADRMAEESSWCDAFTSEVSGRATKEDSHEGSIYRALCEPLLNSTKLLSLMESLLEAGETPSVQLMESLADELSESRDVKATREMLELVRHALPSTAEGDPLSVMHLAVVRTHMFRREMLPALRSLAEMEEVTGRVAGADVLVSMLNMCAAKPAEVLTRELEEVWSQIEERGLTKGAEMQQDLFVSRMAALANCAGQEPDRLSQDAWHRAIEEKLDSIWEDMLKELSASEARGGSAEDAVKLVTGRSWLRRAAALSLCARDQDPASALVMSRSLKSLQAFLRSGELFDDDAVVDLVNVLRGMARCRQADEVPNVLADVRRAVKAAVAEATGGAGVTASMPGMENASFPERIMRALTASWIGHPQEQDQRTACGEQLMEVIQYVADEARCYEPPTLERAQALLAARLHALLSVVVNFGLRDAAGAIREAAACAARDTQTLYESTTSKDWPGASRAALSLLASLLVEGGKAGIDDALATVAKMHRRGLSPPEKAAAQMYGNVWRATRNPATTKRARVVLKLHYQPESTVAESWADKMVAPADNKVMTASGASPNGEEGKRRNKKKHGKAKCGVLDTNPAGEQVPSTRDNKPHATNLGRDSISGDPFPSPSPGMTTTTTAEELDVVSSPQEQYRVIRGMNKWSKRTQPFGYVVDVSSTERACSSCPRYSFLGTSRADLVDQVELLTLKGDALGALDALRAMRGEGKWDGGYDVDAREGASDSAAMTAVAAAGRGLMPVPPRVHAMVMRTIGVANLYSSQSMLGEELARSPLGALDWLLKDMVEQGHGVNTLTLNSGLGAYFRCTGWRKDEDKEGKENCFSEAMDFMGGMCDGWAGLHRPVRPDRTTFTIMTKIAARLGLHSQVIEVMHVMGENGFNPDVATFNAIITQQLARDGEFDIAWQTLLQMTNRGIHPNEETCDKIVLYFLHEGQLSRALSFAQHSFNQYGCTPSAEVFTEVLKSAVEVGDEGKHEARRAVVIAKQLWSPEKRSNRSRKKRGKETLHPVFTDTMVDMLVDHGVYEE